jgi:hypothetical protein
MPTLLFRVSTDNIGEEAAFVKEKAFKLFDCGVKTMAGFKPLAEIVVLPVAVVEKVNSPVVLSFWMRSCGVETEDTVSEPLDIIPP